MNSNVRFFIQYLLIPLSFSIIFPVRAQNQLDELKQKITAFKTDFEENYEMKYLNIADRDLGAIDDTDPEWKDKFMLKSKEKTVNSIGNRSRLKFYFSIYGYETIDDRKYALSDWMKDFINGQSIRPGRTMRSYDSAKPTIILINDLSIITCTYDCSDYTDDNFKEWKKQLLKYFGADNTMVIEVLCDGPLEWTKNPPDLKSKSKYF